MEANVAHTQLSKNLMELSVHACTRPLCNNLGHFSLVQFHNYPLQRTDKANNEEETTSKKCCEGKWGFILPQPLVYVKIKGRAGVVMT